MNVHMVRKKIVVIVAMLLLSQCAYSQLVQNHALGFMLGTSQYNGDINMKRAYYAPYLSAALIYKLRFNNHYIARFSLTYAELQGKDIEFSNAYQQNRKYTFRHNSIYEGSAMMEFNFLAFTYDEKPYKSKREHFFSPYVVAGIALFYADQSEFRDIFAIPMGVGLKYRISSRIELNAEWTFRKTFTDNLDLLNTSVSEYDLYKQAWFNETKDWYSTLGFSVLIAFKKKQSSCTIYEKKAYEHLIKKEKRNRQK